jgi:hypothetical protein
MAALQEVIGQLTTDPSARAALEDDPQGFLVERGLDGFTAEDLRDAMDLAADGLPVHVAAHLTGPEVPPAVAGEPDQEGVLRLLGHAADAPEPPAELDGDHDLDHEGFDDMTDMDFGAGSGVDDTPDGTIDDATDLDLDEQDGVEVEQGDDLEGADDAPDAVDDVPADLIPQLEEEQPDLGQPEEMGEESEEMPGHWGDHQTDEGGLDPHDFGQHLGDLPHA